MLRKFNLFHGELQHEDEQYRRPGYAKRNVRVGEAIGGDLIGGTIYELEEGERVCPYHYHYGSRNGCTWSQGSRRCGSPTASARSGRATSSASPGGPRAPTPCTARDGC